MTDRQRAYLQGGTAYFTPTGVPAPPPDVQQFTADGTWTKPTAPTGAATYTWAKILLVGGGGGGGSGRKGLASTVRTGGGGGGGAGWSEVTVPFSALPATLTITRGAGGAGGSAQATASTDGTTGVAGGATTAINGAFALTATGGVAGPGGSTAAVNGLPVAGTFATYMPTGGASSQSAVQVVALTNSAGPAHNGGAGGAIASNNAVMNGSPALNAPWSTITGAVGVVDTTAPVTGSNPPANVITGGAGGQGGAGSITTNAQAGSNGGTYGGGGGGGGAALDGTGNSGAGGNGANGAVEIVCF